MFDEMAAGVGDEVGIGVSGVEENQIGSEVWVCFGLTGSEPWFM